MSIYGDADFVSSTNAIKFTKDHPVRNVTVTLGGAWTRPSVEWQAMSFAQNGNPQSDICDKPEWGSGRKGFIWLKVVDTGCGMIVDEQKELFSRFTQASPRTCSAGSLSIGVV